MFLSVFSASTITALHKDKKIIDEITHKSYIVVSEK